MISALSVSIVVLKVSAVVFIALLKSIGRATRANVAIVVKKGRAFASIVHTKSMKNSVIDMPL